MLTHHHEEGRGTLSYTEFGDLKFKPERMYLVYGVPKGEVRGNHGHKQDQQYLICAQGQIRVKLTGKGYEEEKVLNPGDSIFMDKRVWGEQEYVTGNDILLVLCSTKFNKDDYIYDIKEIIGN